MSSLDNDPVHSSLKILEQDRPAATNRFMTALTLLTLTCLLFVSFPLISWIFGVAADAVSAWLLDLIRAALNPPRPSMTVPRSLI